MIGRIYFAAFLLLLSDPAFADTSGLALPPAGTVTNELAATASGTATVSVSDPATGVSVTIPPNTMKEGAELNLVVWSAQRPTVQKSGWSASPQAFDLSLDPSSFTGHNTISVQLPWNSTANDRATMIVIFGPTGVSTALPRASGSSVDRPSAIIGRPIFDILAPGASGRVTVQLAVEEQLVHR